MTRVQRREIKKVKFDGPVGRLLGLVTSDQLLSINSDMWQHWRTMLTKGRQGEPDGYKARCVLCDGMVYIAEVSSRDESALGGKLVAPYFKHFGGEGIDCPWYTGEPLNPDDVRRLQYGGAQESELHKELCRTIYDFISADSRCIKSLCDEYLPANAIGQRRRPDVYAELTGSKPVAFELQLSNTNQPEIVERTAFYNQEGIGLVWVFHGVDPNKELMSASLNDVVNNQRNNAFVLDLDARLASLAQQTLMLKCYLRNGLGFEPGQLVRIDKLLIPKKGCMYYEDRLAAPLLQRMATYREKWEMVLEGTKYPDPIGSIAEGVNGLRKELPGLDFRYEGSILIKFISTVLAIIADAKGSYKQFASNQKNVKAMINTYLNLTSTTGLVNYALLLERLIQSTANREMLNGTVGEHIARAKVSYGQPPNHFAALKLDSDTGKLLSRLVPEVFQNNEKAMLIDFDLLPAWAR